MNELQAGILKLEVLLDADKKNKFLKFCDSEDLGKGFVGLSKADYFWNSEDSSMECVWDVQNIESARAYLSKLFAKWNDKFGLSADTSQLKLFQRIHKYHSSGRWDSRSPLMDEVVDKTFTKEPDAVRKLRELNIEQNMPPIALSPSDGHMLSSLLKMIDAKKGVEVGTLGGYSAAWIAHAIGESGQLVSIEKDPARSRTAAENFERVGYSDRAEFRSGHAIDVLKNLNDKDYDFVFIDADKSGYGAYVEWAKAHIKTGGLILCDNAYLWGGMLSFPNNEVGAGADTTATRLHGYTQDEYSGMKQAWFLLESDQKFQTWMLPSGEGLLVSQKISD